MHPIVNGFEERYAAQLAVQRINANEGNGPTLMRQYQLRGHPTILLFDSGGNEEARFIGIHSAEAIEAVILEIVK